MSEKYKTIKEIRVNQYKSIFNGKYKNPYDEISEEAIKCINYGLKHNVNWINLFMRFHDIKEEDLRE